MQFLLWFTYGTFGIFYVAYLKELGYSGKFIAFGLTLSTILGITAQYVWGYISDMTSAIKGIFMISLTFMVLSVAVFPWAVHLPATAIGAMVVFNMAWMPLEGLLDSWLLSSDEIDNEDYGTIRSGGSLGFSVITVFFGGLIVRFGFYISIMAFALAGGTLFLVALTTKTHTVKTPTKMGFKQIKSLLSNPSYFLILVFSVLIFVNHMGINNYYIYVVQGVGGDESLIGQAAAAAAFTEIAGFYVGSKLQKRWHSLFIMTLVAVGYLFRVLLLSWATSYAGVLLTASLQGLTFSLFLGTFKLYIAKITPLSLLATAQTVAASTYFGIASVIANILGGLLIDDYGMKAFYDVLSGISAVAVVFIVGIYWLDRRRVSA